MKRSYLNIGTGNYSKASTDLKNVASGLQSAGGNTARSVGGGGTESASTVPEGWNPADTVSLESTYTWTTPTGSVITEEVEL